MSGISVLIATPAYQGNLYAEYAKAVANLRILLLTKGIVSEWFTINAESLISRGRNACVAYFLSKKEHTHLLFIDADITFNSADVLTLLESDKDICGLPYPKKGYQWVEYAQSVLKSVKWDKVRASIADGKSDSDLIDEQMTALNPDEVMLRNTEYVMNYLSPEISIKSGWLEAAEIGTGFMMIKRNVITDLVQKHPELKYFNDLKGYDNLHQDMADNFYLFFDCRCEPISKRNTDGTTTQTQRYLSEDYAFCKLAKTAGYGTWLYTNCTTHHTGNNTFIGHMLAGLSIRIRDQQVYGPKASTK